MHDSNDGYEADLMIDKIDRHKEAAQAIAVRCYKCTAGCVHFEFGNLLLTFSPQQFLAVSAAFAATRRQLLAGQESFEQTAASVVM
jgi:hypothetical protein